MSTMPTTNLSRSQIRRIFRRHPGTISGLADSLKIRTASVSIWLSNKSNSARIEEAAIAKAAELLELERSKQRKTA